MIVCSFLDPSVKDLPIISSYCQTNEVDIVSLLIKKWHEYGVELSSQISKKKSPDKKESTTSAATKLRLELIQQYVHSGDGNSEQNDVEANIHKEYAQYIPMSDLVANPLIWWKKHQNAFPYLASLAKVMLAIPASSASTERHFNDAGVLITKKKAQLDPLNAEKILFVHSNFEYISGSEIDHSLEKFSDFLYS